MSQYYIEGLYATKAGVKKQRKTGNYPAGAIELYARAIWAASPQEAFQLATNDLQGGAWTEEPRISQVTEEQRMRSAHQPEFPGLSPQKPAKRKP